MKIIYAIGILVLAECGRSKKIEDEPYHVSDDMEQDYRISHLKTAVKRCPGMFCGRMKKLTEDGEFLGWSECGACARGFRANFSICEECKGEPSFYDWTYLLFNVILALIGHGITIDICMESLVSRSFFDNAFILHVTSFFEVCIAAALTLILHEPIGSLTLRSCGVKGLPDWYTVFFNPRINFEKTIYCTQEAVYPLYTMVILFYGLSLVMMLTIRPIILTLKKVPVHQGRNSVYIAMYFLPVLAFCHAAIGGLLYFSFPYILILIALTANAIHFGGKADQSFRDHRESAFGETSWFHQHRDIRGVDVEVAAQSEIFIAQVFRVTALQHCDEATTVLPRDALSKCNYFRKYPLCTG
ncbi:unnamed protein product [Notodromas monacha]|uniref:JNK1/MAPK8-associated membrane protein n=1 Tax=Notodromas monacha TaxID=399045 RepID=A0A7R9BS03_9CRUS|nr:unnamed protein product [Notodromas monacha]CAG0919692.1 unnamed protein product [Notodromas monacha]